LSGLFPVAGDLLGPGSEAGPLQLQSVGQVADLLVEVGVLRGQFADRPDEFRLIWVVRCVASLRDLARGWLVGGVPVIGRSVKGHVSRLEDW
jgi:hypothetical protein